MWKRKAAGTKIQKQQEQLTYTPLGPKWIKAECCALLLSFLNFCSSWYWTEKFTGVKKEGIGSSNFVHTFLMYFASAKERAKRGRSNFASPFSFQACSRWGDPLTTSINLFLAEDMGPLQIFKALYREDTFDNRSISVCSSGSKSCSDPLTTAGGGGVTSSTTLLMGLDQLLGSHLA